MSFHNEWWLPSVAELIVLVFKKMSFHNGQRANFCSL